MPNFSSSHSKYLAQQSTSASHTSTLCSTPYLSHRCGPISQEKWEYRTAQRLCIYCGDPDPTIQDCSPLQNAIKKGHTKLCSNTLTISSISASTTSPPFISSAITVVPPSEKPPPQSSQWQDHWEISQWLFCLFHCMNWIPCFFLICFMYLLLFLLQLLPLSTAPSLIHVRLLISFMILLFHS